MNKQLYTNSVSNNTARKKLLEYFSDKLETAYHLNRKMVSFQANKSKAFYRWFKYKEGFSSDLVQHFIFNYSDNTGKILDPFAGVGSTLFAAHELNWDAYGIELLPVGNFVVKARIAFSKIDAQQLKNVFYKTISCINNTENYKQYIEHIPITNYAFSQETELQINKYLTEISKINDENLQIALKFIAFSVLEEISYTRKDGQYLRWDYRSNRNLSGKPFDKGNVLSFSEATTLKLNEIISDMSQDEDSLFPTKNKIPSLQNITLTEDTCLKQLPKIEDNFFDFIMTSPPYCNRYDYTRTYALELVYLSCNHQKIKELRQEMLSCTVENKEKINYLKELYISMDKNKSFEQIMNVYNGSKAMQEVNEVLCELNKLEKLNNKNIARMVKNYFLEMCFVIYEMSRVLKNNGYCVMVNDNVRYGGEEIPIDLILSDFAEKFGFDIEKIFVLPKGKGNSSQQMGLYGRAEIRKCVYIWRKK